jgi:hypothetical protein
MKRSPVTRVNDTGSSVSATPQQQGQKYGTVILRAETSTLMPLIVTTMT